MKAKRTIQNKIIVLILIGVLFSSFMIGGLGIASFRVELQKSVVSPMNLTCEEKAEELNSILGRIEQSTEVMAVLAENYVESVELLKDETYRTECIEHLTHAGHNIAKNTKGAAGIFFRLNPEIAGTTEGFYWLVNNRTGELILVENTDVTKYNKDDTENVGWYYEPMEAGRAVWLDSYENQKMNKQMVSYAMPIYKENQMLGVVGVEVDWPYITDIVDAIKVYESGYAFLVDDEFCIAHSKEFEVGTSVAGFSDEISQIDKAELIRSDRVFQLEINGVKKTAAFTEINNGKIMAVIVPDDEINAEFNALVMRIITIVVIISFLFVLITIQLVKSIIRPLKELNQAAQDIANGNLDVDLNICSDDEVGVLAQSFKETARQLKIRIEYINNLAYYDKLTGVKNNTAYLQNVAYIKNSILEKTARFTIFVIDVNGLKYMNDNYGHEVGNELLIKVTQLIVEVFGEENTYRIGGDEFAVILSDLTEEEGESYCKFFDEVVENQKGKIWASASIGYARFSKKLDSTYESVFNRADEDMYEKKVRMKADGKNSRMIEL